MREENLIPRIIQAIHQTQQEELYYETLYHNPEINARKNEMLFFSKPEVTLPDENIRLEDIFHIILTKFQDYAMYISRVNVISAAYLADYHIIDQHYGVINSIAKNAAQNMSDTAAKTFNAIYNKTVSEAKVLGGLEFLEHYPDYTASSLNTLWESKKADKLAGGTYCVPLTIHGEEVYLVNGFHPQQLNHFTTSPRSIITFDLETDTDWATARKDFIGATNPDEANTGSIRNILNNKQEELGLQISPSRNGAHLSAGPVEGLVELLRYNSNFNINDIRHPSDFKFGRQLLDHFSPEKVETLLENPTVTYNGENISVFDLTEEMNSDEAIDLLKTIQF